MEKVWEWKLSGSKGASMCSLVHYLNSEDLLIFSLLLAFPVSHGVSQAIYPSSWICAGRQSLPLGLWKWWNDIEKEMINELSMDVLLLGDNICNTKVILSLGAANYICKPSRCGWGCLRHTISIAIATSNPFHPQHVFHSFKRPPELCLWWWTGLSTRFFCLVSSCEAANAEPMNEVLPGNSCWDIVQNFCPKANCGGSRFWFNDAGRLRHMLWWMSCPRLEKLGSKIADSWIMTLPIPGGHNPANNHCSALICFFPINRLVLQRRSLAALQCRRATFLFCGDVSFFQAPQLVAAPEGRVIILRSFQIVFMLQPVCDEIDAWIDPRNLPCTRLHWCGWKACLRIGGSSKSGPLSKYFCYPNLIIYNLYFFIFSHK